jgi:sporulation protein YlmC with PRC-barrel domain
MDVGARRATELLTLPVTHNGIGLGRAVDVLLDLDSGRAVGLEVRCGDEVFRFLPLGAARLGPDEAEVGSPLGLIDDLAFYRARGTAFRDLRGARVARAGAFLGALSDVLVSADGTISRLLVETPSGTTEVRFTRALSFGRERDASAA